MHGTENITSVLSKSAHGESNKEKCSSGWGSLYLDGHGEEEHGSEDELMHWFLFVPQHAVDTCAMFKGTICQDPSISLKYDSSS